MENPQTETTKPTIPTNKTNAGSKSKKPLMILLVILLMVASAAGGYFYRDNKAKDEQKKSDAQISSLQSQLATAQKDAATAKAALAAATKKTTVSSVQPSATVLANIHDSITSGNTAALEGYMASSVNVILAASEAYGAQTPTQAVSDVTTFLKNTTSPWDFSLPAATLASYRAGDYKQYFPSTAYVGKSHNSYVISFQFDANAKINGIFMAAAGVL